MQDKDEYGQKVCFQIENIGSPLMIENIWFKKSKKISRLRECFAFFGWIVVVKREAWFDESDVEKIIVEAPEAHLKNLMFTDPKTPMEAKFSL